MVPAQPRPDEDTAPDTAKTAMSTWLLAVANVDPVHAPLFAVLDQPPVGTDHEARVLAELLRVMPDASQAQGSSGHGSADIALPLNEAATEASPLQEFHGLYRLLREGGMVAWNEADVRQRFLALEVETARYRHHAALGEASNADDAEIADNIVARHFLLNDGAVTEVRQALARRHLVLNLVREQGRGYNSDVVALVDSLLDRHQVATPEMRGALRYWGADWELRNIEGRTAPQAIGRWEVPEERQQKLKRDATLRSIRADKPSTTSTVHRARL